MVELKRCTKCGCEKAGASFEQGKNSCRDCRNDERRNRRARQKLEGLEPFKNRQEYAKRYAAENAESLRSHKTKYREKNRERLQREDRERYEKNRETVKAAATLWRKSNPERRRQTNRTWVARNADKARECNRRNKARRRGNTVMALAERVRNLISASFRARGYAKRSRTHEILGCDFETLAAHLAAKFQPGMSWENRGEWHIDHIVPLAMAQTEEDVIRLNHYTNLQPLWAADNLAKGARLDWVPQTTGDIV